MDDHAQRTVLPRYSNFEIKLEGSDSQANCWQNELSFIYINESQLSIFELNGRGSSIVYIRKIDSFSLVFSGSIFWWRSHEILRVCLSNKPVIFKSITE